MSAQLRSTYSSQLVLPIVEDANYERSDIGEVEQKLVDIDDALTGLRNLVQKVHTMKSVICNFREGSEDINRTDNEVLHKKQFDNESVDENKLRTPTYSARCLKG